MIFTDGAATTSTSSTAATVGDFLRERGIAPGENDLLEPAANTPLSDNISITYRAALPVTIVMENRRETLLTSAPDVATLLANEHIHLAAHDTVTPGLDAPLAANDVVQITRVIAWQKTIRKAIAMRTIRRLDFSLKPGVTKIRAKGHGGIVQEVVAFVKDDDGPIDARVIRTRVIRPARPRVVAIGPTEMQAYEHFVREGVARSSYEMQSSLEMIATAYTAGCAGCSGITASGRPAGHGVVAVDPNVIPLGTRLYIPGYGFAIAGDTGGAIRGDRIDLGFDSLRDALIFGRREVTVYRLK